jgi:negative regulator of flagellin synthesis FlgM
MEITGKSSVQLDAYVQQLQGQKPDKASPTEGSQAKRAQDKVVLSPRAKEIQKAAEQLKTASVVREEKVAEIRSQLAQGTYKVDGAATAFEMVRESLVNTIA